MACRAVVAIGSNQGDRVDLFRRALRLLNAAGIVVERHSSLYETAPAYVADQPVFLNAAFVARVDDPDVGADPIKLLDALKRVERELGRVDGGVRFGPRPIDLDIIFHGGGAVNRERLTVPHPRYRERGFVLAPLADLDVDLDADSDADDSDADAAAAAADADATSSSSSSSSDRVISRSLRTARAIWSAAGGERNVGGDEMRRVMPLRDGLWSWKDDDAAVMGVLNVTPDSFSDGGALNTRVNRNGDDADVTSKSAVDLDAVVRAARRMADDGAMFLDVGGQSTRPGATRVSAADESARVVPAVAAVVAAFASDVARGARAFAPYVSVDTFYGAVATRAVEAGADVINDVSAGSLDPEMRAAVAALPFPAPYVAMHMRGDPSDMQSTSNVTYAEGDTCGVVGIELAAAARKAAKAGIEPWRLWLDPGIGFAKTARGCAELTADLGAVRDGVTRGGGGGVTHAPMLYGASRKGFLGALIARGDARGDAGAAAAPPSACDVATSAANAVAVAQPRGADVVRVHDVKHAVDAVKVASEMRRARREREREAAARGAARESKSFASGDSGY